MLPKRRFQTKLSYCRCLADPFSSASSCRDCWLPKTERHYSECGGKITSIFLPTMPMSYPWLGSPKGALMQTPFACVGDFDSPNPRQWAFLPLDPDQPCAVWIPETFRRFMTTRGGDPLPVAPSQPCAVWNRGRAFAPCTTPGAFPCDPSICGGFFDPCPLWVFATAVFMEPVA